MTAINKKIQEQLAQLTREDKISLIEALEAYDEKVRFNMKAYLFPDEGPLRRDLYPKHCEFFRATRDYPEVAFVAGSRCGKSFAGCYADASWLSGDYPDWWEGKVFDDPITMWIVAPSNQKIKEGVQETLFGKKGAFGTGIIPKKYIDFDSIRSYHGTDVIEDAYIYFKGNKKLRSKLTFKSAEQKLESFESSAVDVIHHDEVSTLAIYTACLARTLTTDGINISTYTPIKGLDDLVKIFLPSGRFPPRGSGTVEAPFTRV